MRAFIGMGSNLDGPLQRLQQAMDALANIPETSLTAVSSCYRSQPVGPRDQPEYVNAVAELETDLAPQALLQSLQAIENAQGRTRNGERWGPRTLDLDILLYSDAVIETETLTVPHPELHNRGFVLLPLHEIAPESTVPGRGPVATLLAGVDTADLQKLTD